MEAKKIIGNWYNELGSVMKLQINGNNIVGTYHTLVGDAEGIYPLMGIGDFDNHQSEALGWVVSWNNEFKNSDSVTVWSGQYQEKNEEDVILTTWLLTSESRPQDDWRSTLVGTDIFYRQPIEKMNKNIRNIKRSFPLT
jgi:hypothetical protein